MIIDNPVLAKFNSPAASMRIRNPKKAITSDRKDRK